MYCAKCDNELSKCVCPDLGERVEALAKSPHLFISPEKLKAYREQARRNSEEQERAEWL